MAVAAGTAVLESATAAQQDTPHQARTTVAEVAGAHPVGPTRRLTLPTGDRLLVGPHSSLAAISVDPATASGKTVLHRFVRHGQRFAVPDSAAASRARGQLDLGKFNVDRLVGRTRESIPDTPRAPVESPGYDLTIRVIDRFGADNTGYASVTNLDTGEVRWYVRPGETVRLPQGRYGILSRANDRSPTWDGTLSMYAHPQMRLNQDTTVTLDHRLATKVTVQPDDSRATEGTYCVTAGTLVEGQGMVDSETLCGLYPQTHIYVGSVPGATSPEFRLFTDVLLQRPAVEITVTDPERFPVRAGWMVDSPRRRLSGSLPVVHAHAGTEADLAAVDVRGAMVIVDLVEDNDQAELAAMVSRIARAGGRLVLFHRVDAVTATTGLGAADPRGGATLALPSAWLERTLAGDRLIDLATKGTAHVSVASIPATPVRYTLGLVDRGAAGRSSHRIRTADLAAVPTRYYQADGPMVWTQWATAREATAEASGVWLGNSDVLPTQRTEYYTPGSWKLSADGPVRPDDVIVWNNLGQSVALRTGPNPTIAWNQAVIGPTVAGTGRPEGVLPWAYQSADQIDVMLPLYGDGAGHPRLAGYRRGDHYSGHPGLTRLYRDGVLVGEAAQAGIATFPVDPAQASYRLVAQARADDPLWTLSTSVSAEWTFRSAGAGTPRALPLLTVRYLAPVDLSNSAPAGRTMTVPVVVESAAGAVSSLSVHVSTDDGATWVEPKGLARSGAGWSLTVANPGSGHVSLRAEAADSQGNTVTQTIIRAYKVAG